MNIENRNELIISLYNEGLSHREIGEKVGMSTSGVGYVLNKSGIKGIKGKEDKDQLVIKLHKEGLSNNEIAKKLGLSKSGVGYTLNVNGIKGERTIKDYDIRKHSVNDKFFSEIDNELSAYWLGFLMADGYVDEKDGHLSLTLKDADMVELFKQDINASYPILLPKGYSKIDIASKQIVEDLVKLGCIQNKTFVLEFPKINETLIHHFIRGYFDGDGSIWTDNSTGAHKSSFMGTESFMLEIKRQIGLEHRAKVNKKTGENIYRYTISGNNLNKKVRDYLYKDATRYMNRKKERFDQIK